MEQGLTSVNKTIPVMRRFKILFQLLKVDHWIKNLYLFAPVFFGGQFLADNKIYKVGIGFLLFCLAASFVYIVNDLIDAAIDRHHPKKQHRPIASGQVTSKRAMLVLFILFILVIIFSWLLQREFFVFVIVFILMNLAYSIWLKHIPILDVSVISFGFVLRVLAGGSLSAVVVSHWLIIMIYLLSMFLALAKRREDLLLINNGAVDPSVRRSVNGYNIEFMQAALVSMATVMVVCYIMYITSSEVKERLHSEYAYFNSFFVVAGVLKYLQIIFTDSKAASPTEVMLSNRFIQVCVLLWIFSFIIMLYFLK